MQKKSNVHRFIEEERAKGTSDKEIRHQLLEGGWGMDIIQHAMQENETSHPKTSKVKPTEPWQRRLLRHPMFYIGVFIVLVLIALFI